MSVLLKKVEEIGKSKLAQEVKDDDTSDYSESMARSATHSQGFKTQSKYLRWNVDSGTTNSLVPTSVPIPKSEPGSLTLRTANNARIDASSKGAVPVSGLGNVIAHQIEDLAEPLLSVADVTNQNVGTLFLKDEVLFVDQPNALKEHINHHHNVLSRGPRINRSYYIENSEVSFRASQSSSALLMTWHLRLGHIGLRNLLDLQRRKEITVSIDDREEVIRCEDCVTGKFNRLNMRSRERHRVSDRLDCVHSDLCQLPEKSRTGIRYIMTFLDEHTNYGVIYFLKLKSQSFECFKHYVSWAERHTNLRLRKVRTDNGGEYTCEKWSMYCRDSGIEHSMGPPHSPQLNGKAERFNRTILDRLLPTLFHSKLPVRFWEDAARSAVNGLNSSPSRTNPGQAAPVVLWEGKSTSYQRMRTFGCKCWRLITGPARGGKLSPKSSPCLHLYTLSDGDGWMVWDLSLSRAVKSHDVLFFEDEFPGLGAVNHRTQQEWLEWTVAPYLTRINHVT